MTSKLIVNSVRHTGASADGITMAADGSVTFPGNATCSGTATGFADVDYVKLQRGTNAGGAGDLIFDNLDVATYKIFEFYAAFVPENDAIPYFRFRTGGASGADVNGTHYGYGYRETYPTDNGLNKSASSQNEVRLHGTSGNNTGNGEGFRINIRMFFADSSDNGSTPRLGNFINWSSSRHDGSGNYRSATGNAAYNENDTTFPTGFKIFMASGAINANTFALYGLKR